MLAEKKKTILTILIVLLALGSVVWVTAGAQSLGTVRSRSISENDLAGIEQSRTPSSSHLIDAVFFGEEKLFFDMNANTFYYSIIENDPAWDNPSLTVQSNDSSVKVSFVNPDLSRNAVAENRPLRMIAYTDKEYREYRVAMTTLPMMNIITDHDLPRAAVSVSAELFDNSGETGMYFSKSFGTAHVRGHSSSGMPKMPLRLILKSSVGKNESRDANLLGLRESNKWVLYSPYNEPFRVRNMFSYELWYRSSALNNSYGLVNSSRYKYVELFLNGEYFGLYGLGYMPDEAQTSLDKSLGEMSYKCIDWFKYRQKEEPLNHYFTVVDAYWGYGTDYDVRERDIGEGTEEEFQLLQDYIDFMNEDHTLQEQIDLVDFKDYVDFYLFQNVIQGNDCAQPGKTKNYYITAKKDGDGYRYLYTPWDLDITWGFIFGNFEMDYTHDYAFDLGPFAAYPPEENEDIVELLRERYRELRESEWSDQAILQILDGFEEDIFASGAYVRDLERWPESKHIEGELSLSEFKTYVLNRFHYCDRYYQKVN